MIICVPFHEKDRQAAERMLNWCADLSGRQPYTAVIGCENDIDPSGVQRAASRAFSTVERLVLKSTTSSWPSSPNDYFAIVANAMRGKASWLWLEPDCVFVHPRGLDMLAADHQRSGKGCLGAKIPQFFNRNGVWTQIGEMLAGVAIYDPNLWDHSPLLRHLRTTNAEYARAKQQPRAFDSYLANEILPLAAATPLIQHMGRSIGFRREDGRIVCSYGPESRWSNVLAPETVLVHGVKDTSLIDLLRAEMNLPEKAGTAQQVPFSPPANVTLAAKAVAPKSAWGEDSPQLPEPLSQPAEKGGENIRLRLAIPAASSAALSSNPAGAANAGALAAARQAIEHWPECQNHLHTLQSKIGRYRVACQCGASSPKLPEGVDWEAAWSESVVDASPENVKAIDSPATTLDVSERLNDDTRKTRAGGLKPGESETLAAKADCASPEFKSQRPKPKKRRMKQRRKPNRTAEAQAAINARMEKARAARKPVAVAK